MICSEQNIFKMRAGNKYKFLVSNNVKALILKAICAEKQKKPWILSKTEEFRARFCCGMDL